MSQLRIDNLAKTFPNGVPALRDFSLTVAEGELVAIVGPSGCGKSTLLRIVAGLEIETGGIVQLGDRRLNGLPPKQRDIAIVFQSYTLLPHLTVEENLGFGLKLRGVPAAIRSAKVHEIARTLGIADLLRRAPSEISGGERQRVALGRAILREPELFLFDEPLSSLDAKMRAQLRVEIQSLHQRLPTPMIFVTHDQSEALTLGDRVAVLDHGQLQQVADPDTLYGMPANTFVASFIGSPGMNLFPGHLESHGGHTRFLSPALKFILAPEQANALASRSEIIAGIRPEHLRLREGNDAELRGTLTAVERQGGQACLYLREGEQAFAAKVSGGNVVKPGSMLGFTFPPAQATFFEPGTGMLLLPGSSRPENGN